MYQDYFCPFWFGILLWLRDYKQDVEAIVAAKLPTWRLQHLGLWVDLVEPPTPAAVAASPAELMELEDQANAAKFRELRAKIAQDQAAMTSYHAQLEEGKRRSHVVNIMHERAQVEAGKQLLVPSSSDSPKFE